MYRFPAILVSMMVCACGGSGPADPVPQSNSAPVAFTNAAIWDGTGAPVRRGENIVVRDGRIASVGSDEPPAEATTIDLGGSYVIPGLINTHGHITANWARSSVTDATERVREGLRLYARYGVTTVLSLGGEPDEAFALRAAFDPADPGHARFYLAGPVVADDTAIAAREQALANLGRGVDWLKLRVDDGLGRGQKMPWEAVQAVLEVGRERDVPVATHIFYRDDAIQLLDMGTAMIAHSVRDEPVDDRFVAALAAAGVCYVPTLTRDLSTFIYADTPEFFEDPFFLRSANHAQVARVSDPEFRANMAESEIAAGYREALAQAMENLGTLSDAGAAIGLGTDSGPPARFPGYFEHLELEMMVEAGMTPEEALISATGRAAECIGLADVGTLEAGKWADFLVLADDPTADIANTKSLQRVFMSGREIR